MDSKQQAELIVLQGQYNTIEDQLTPTQKQRSQQALNTISQFLSPTAASIPHGVNTIEEQLIETKQVIEDLAAAKKELEKVNPSLTGSSSIPAYNSNPPDDDAPSLESDAVDKNKGELEKDDKQGTASKTPTTNEHDPIKVFFDMLIKSLLKLGNAYLAHQEYLHNQKTYRNNKTIDSMENLEGMQAGVGQSIATAAKEDPKVYSNIKKDIEQNQAKLTNSLVNHEKLDGLLTKKTNPAISPNQQAKKDAIVEKRSKMFQEIAKCIYKNSILKNHVDNVIIDKIADHLATITDPNHKITKSAAKNFVNGLVIELRITQENQNINGLINHPAENKTIMQVPKIKPLISSPSPFPTAHQLANKSKSQQENLFKQTSTSTTPTPPSSNNTFNKSSK